MDGTDALTISVIGDLANIERAVLGSPWRTRRISLTIHSSPGTSCRRSKRAVAPAPRRAGSRRICSRATQAARLSAQCRSTPKIIPTANTSSIMPGPTRCSARAAIIIRSFSALCRSRRCLGGASWRVIRRCKRRWRRPRLAWRSARAHHRCTRRLRTKIWRGALRRLAIRRALGFSITGSITTMRPSPIFWPSSRRRSARTSAASVSARVRALRIRRLRGAEITPRDWDFFFRCYMDTGSRKWGSPYLNRVFFDLLGQRMADQCVLFVAEEADGTPARLRAQSRRRRGALRPLLGAHRRRAVLCTLSFAIIRRSNSRLS